MRGNMSQTLAELAIAWGDFSARCSRRKQILIVDDDPGTCTAFSTILTQREFSCEVVQTGKAARTILEPGRFDAVIVDKHLPDGDGLDLVRQIHKIDRDCEVVVVTGFANLDSVLAAINLRAADYLVKPLDSIDILPAVVSRAVRRRHRRLLARRMLADLRGAVSQRADDTTAPQMAAARERVNDFAKMLTTKRRILISASERANLKSTMFALETKGFVVHEVVDGDTALTRCTRGEVDVLIVSDRFTDMTGLELVDQVLATDHRPELVFVSGRSTFEDALAAVSRGAAAYDIRPIKDTDAFCRRVEQALANHHERLYHYKMVKELYAVVATMEKRAEDSRTRRRITATLGEFDIITAEKSIKPYEE